MVVVVVAVAAQQPSPDLPAVVAAVDGIWPEMPGRSCT